jgi:hypothetical protein
MATFFEQIIGKLFSNPKTKIVHKENFTHGQIAQQEVADWLVSEDGKNILALIHKNYHFKTAGISASPQIHLLKSPYANGFAITFEKPFTEKQFELLFHAFGKLILNLQYYQVSLDRKIEENNQQVKVIEKLYLKPIVHSLNADSKIDQRYGNVSIEKVSDGRVSSYLKLLVTVYQDHLYEKALSFDQFIEDLFQSTPS